MNTQIYIITLIILTGCSVDTPSEPEIEADFTAEELARFANRDPNGIVNLAGQTLTIKGTIWQIYLDTGTPYFTLRTSADIQIYLLDESLETYQKLLTRQTEVVVQGFIESVELPNTIIFVSAVLLN